MMKTLSARELTHVKGASLVSYFAEVIGQKQGTFAGGTIEGGTTTPTTTPTITSPNDASTGLPTGR